MIKILLMFPNPISTIPGGLTYVGKRFKKNGFEVKIHVNTFRSYRNIHQLKNEIIDSYKPDIVGFSYATLNLLEIYTFQKLCSDSGYFVIAGGNHPSVKPEECLINGADLVFRGEAELGIDDFCSWYESGCHPDGRDCLRGVSFIDESGKVIHNPSPQRIDLDETGSMDLSCIDLEEFRMNDGSIKGIHFVYAGRGCPYRCSYCSHSDWYQYKFRSPANVVEEIHDKFEKYGVKNFWLADETFTINKENVYQFCRLMNEHKMPVTWSAGTRVTNVDKNLLLAMKEAGLVQITYGVESADDITLKRINKGYSAQKAYQIVEMTGKLGIPMYLNLMTGFPWETVESVENNINFITKVDRWVNMFQLYGSVIPYPDTPIYDEFHEKYGFTDFWLKDKFQTAGQCVYQNVVNPYKVSTFFQRNLYDDTYVADDYFFQFTPEYKKAVARMGMLIGMKSLKAQYTSAMKQQLIYSLGYLSRSLYDISPELEKKLIGSIKHRNMIHENRMTAKFIKK